MTLFGILALICLTLALLAAGTVRLLRRAAKRHETAQHPVRAADLHFDADVLAYLATVFALVPAAWLIHYAITALEAMHAQL